MKTRLKPARFKYKEQFHTSLGDMPKENDCYWRIMVDGTSRQKTTAKWYNPNTSPEELVKDYENFPNKTELILFQYQQIKKDVIRPVEVLRVDLRDYPEQQSRAA